jgi:hypothetical protein
MAANGMTTATVREMIPTLLFPFNLLKALVNVGVVLLLYKSLSRALRRAKILPHSTKAMPRQATPPTHSRLVSILMPLVAVVLISVCLVVIFTVMGGKFDFGI